ncbi:MAG TPA: gamma-glutamyl-phosphate reductase, partial [Nevskiaceae bacterium]
MSTAIDNLEHKPAFQEIGSYMLRIGRQAKAAATAMARAATGQKNGVLFAFADQLTESRDQIMAANAEDLDAAREAGLAPALMDRLQLTDSRFTTMVDGVRQVAALPDPIGEIIDLKPRPSGIEVGHMRVPLGVIGIIYESRPNVTADAAGLCLKSGNAVVLRGGSEAFRTNCLIADVLRDAATTIPR